MDKHHSKREFSLSSEEVFKGFDLDNNLWTEASACGSQTTTIGRDFENGLKRIHAFVDRVRSSTGPAFRFAKTRHSRDTLERTRLSSIPTGSFITPEFRSAYVLSEQVTTFLELEDEFGLLDERSFCEPLRESWIQPGKRVGDVANDFVQVLRYRTANKAFRRQLTERKHNFKENFQHGRDFINDLFAKSSRLVVVRVDLAYKQEHWPTLETAKSDFESLLNNRRHNAIFDSYVGCIWRLEYAIRTGYHFHVMFFFRGSEVWKDGYIASRIGKYWEGPITNRRGRHHNCNYDKNKYKQIGIGVMNDHDHEKRWALVHVALKYLTKIDELVRPILPKGTKSFGTSQAPKPHSGLGRKRTSR